MRSESVVTAIRKSHWLNIFTATKGDTARNVKNALSVRTRSIRKRLRLGREKLRMEPIAEHTTTAITLRTRRNLLSIDLSLRRDTLGTTKSTIENAGKKKGEL